MAESQPPLILALDVGTSSARALVFDRAGLLLSGVSARRHYTIPVRADGAAETDADELLDQVLACVDEALEQLGPRVKDLAAVAACTFVSNIVGLDAQGQPLTPLVTYADTRAAPQADLLRQQLDERTVHQRTGCRFHPCYWPAYLLWVKQTQPELFSKVRRWVSLGEYLQLRLFGETAVSFSVASWTGLLDLRALTWDAPLLELLSLPAERLSLLVDADRPFAGLKGEFARRWPALSRLPWFPAIGDGAASNLGSGCVSPGQVAIMMGTTSAVRVVLHGEVPAIPDGLWCYRVDRRRPLLGGALTEGGNVLDWLSQVLNLSGIPDLESALAKISPSSNGLTFLPLIAGERSPGWAGGARGALAGLSLATTPFDILQAGMAGVCLRIAQVYTLLRQVLPGDPEVIASGGTLLHSPAWTRMLVDVLGRPVTESRAAEASARGTALLALESLGLLPEVGAASPLTGPVHIPDPESHRRYQQAARKQQELYDLLYRGGC